MNSKLKVVKNHKDLGKLIKYCKQTKYASVDFETNAKPIQSDLFVPTMLGVSFQVGGSWLIPLAHKDSPLLDVWEEYFTRFCKEVIEDPNVTKIAHNLKFEYTIFLRYGIVMQGRLFDTMLAKYLLDENSFNGLKGIVSKYLPEFDGYENGASKEFKNLPWDEKPIDELSVYCGLDCDLTFRLMVFFERKLIDLGFYELFRNMLMMGTRVLAESELRGMHIDMDYLDELEGIYTERLIELKASMRTRRILKYEIQMQKTRIAKMIALVQTEIEEIEKSLENDELDDKQTNSAKRKITSREDKLARYAARDFTSKKELQCLEEFNPSSDAQLRDLLFFSRRGYQYGIVKYTIDKKTKQETTSPSTDKEAMGELLKVDKDGFIKDLLEYKKISKLYSTYVKGFQERITIDDCIHGRFLLHGTVTGRLSSREPNLQNIPRDTTAKEIKKMFVPPEGKLMFQLDYSQAELRVLAAQAGETAMIEWFHSGKDIHLASACKKMGWEYDWALPIYKKEDKDDPEFTKIKIARKQAKTINFGIVYGQGAAMLAGTLSDPDNDVYVNKAEAQSFLDDFFMMFPQVKTFMDKQHKFVMSNGYVKNVFGRKRRLPNAFLPLKSQNQRSNNWGKVAEAKRASVNAPIQGAASDYTLFSSIIIWEKIQAGELPKSLQQVATVHDSLIYYIDPKDIHKIVPILSAVCENPQTMKYFNFQIDDVLMKVDFEVGPTWAELATYKPDIDYTAMIN